MYVTELDTENLHVLQNEFVTRSLSVFMDWLAGWLAGCAVYQNHVKNVSLQGRESETEARQSPDPLAF